MWDELTILWNDLTILWNDLTIDWNDLTWNDLTMERNDRIPFKQRNDLAFSDNSATESLFVELDRAKEKTSLSVSSIDRLIKRLRTFCVT